MRTISAVVPAYNAGEYINETLNSLIHQSCQLSEIIVVDDGSSDHTVQIVGELSRRHSHIRLLRNTSNIGVSLTRNRGVAAANSEWVLFIDADDTANEYLVEKYMMQYEEMEKQNTHSNFILIHGAYQQIDAAGKLVQAVTRFKQVQEDEILGYEFVRNHIYLSGTIVHRGVFLESGGFNSDYRYCEDWDLWLRLAQIGGFVYVDDPLVHVRRHSQNVSSAIKNVQAAEREILQKYPLLFIEKAIDRRCLPVEENKIDFVSILYRLDCWDEGKKVLQQLEHDYPDNISGYFFSGLYALHTQNIQEAEHYFSLLLERNPNDAATLNNLGVCNFINGNRTASQAYFEQALSLINNYLDATINLEYIKSNPQASLQDLRITWRKLRPVLLNYES